MIRPIVKCLCILAAFSLSPAFLQAQDSTKELNSLKPGAWALQFGIGGNFTLTSFQGASFAAKYHLSESSAVRAGISIGGNTGDATGSSTMNQTDTITYLGSQNKSSNNQALNFMLQYLWYANPKGVIHFYTAIGTSLLYYRQSDNQDGSTTLVGTAGYVSWTTSSYVTKQWGAGVVGAAGVEWFPAQWLSLRAEYGEGIQYQWASSTTTETSSLSTSAVSNAFRTSSSDGDGWTLYNISASLGLNVYF